jgi:hypothetical protein
VAQQQTSPERRRLLLQIQEHPEFQIVSGATNFFNGAAATIKGIDVDLQAVPIKNLTIKAQSK